MLALDRLQSLLNTFPRLTIGLVGDLFMILPELEAALG